MLTAGELYWIVNRVPSWLEWLGDLTAPGWTFGPTFSLGLVGGEDNIDDGAVMLGGVLLQVPTTESTFFNLGFGYQKALGADLESSWCYRMTIGY
jgi:hypothetical protein